METHDDTIFHTLADPTRREILRLIGQRESMSVTEIAESFPQMTRNAVSAHLRILRMANLVESRNEGRYRMYSLGPNRADAVIDFLMSVYRDSLERLAASVVDDRADAESLEETG